MITNAERDHVKALKEWCKQLRAAPEHPFVQKIKMLLPEADKRVNDIAGNIEWLIAIVERESDLQIKRRLRGE